MLVRSPFPLYTDPSDPEPLALHDRFDLALVDPPWQHNDRNANGRRGAAFKYDVHELAEIGRLDVPAVLMPDAVVVIWCVRPMPGEAQALGADWGLEYVTELFTWVKTRTTQKQEAAFRRAAFDAGLSAHDIDLAWRCALPYILPTLHFSTGHHTRSNTEGALLFRRGRGLERVDAGVSQVVIAQLGGHSEKPEEVHRRLERLYGDTIDGRPIRRIELFARARQPGWMAWGNDIRDENNRPAPPDLLMPLRPDPALMEYR